jgi:release factor glutamine methyltransferase
MATIRETLSEATCRLAAAGIEAPAREARLLLAHALRMAPHALPAADAACDPAMLEPVLRRRLGREPLALIAGTRGFWTLELAVSGDTLIPRPDSETLIEAAIALFPNPKSVRHAVDLGTGTGCLLLAALAHFTSAFGVGVDVSAAAAALAARNAAANGLADRAAFLAGDWDMALSVEADLVLCNPPYIASGDLPALMPEVRDFEPARALDGGVDGLAAYRRLIPALPALLTTGGVAILELGAGQLDAVTDLAERAKFGDISTRRDLAGIPRALVLADPRKKPFGIGRGGG